MSKDQFSKEVATSQIVTCAFGRVEVNLEEDTAQTIEQVKKGIDSQDKDFLPGLTWGYDFFAFGKPFTRTRHIRKMKKFTDLTIVAKPEPLKAKVKKEEEVED